MTDMQKIDFHYNVPDRLRYACLVARTVYRRGLTLAVFDDLAFLPHVRAGSPLAGETPIRLSNRLEELEGDVLLLLDDQLPPEWQERLDRFSRIIDVVSTKPEELQASRSRFRAYKAAGVELAAYDRRS